MSETGSTHSEFERIAIALFLAALGFLTGIVSVWMLTNLPGVETGRPVYLSVAACLSVTCFVLGYRSSHRTADLLGGIWNATWKISGGVFRLIRLLSR